MSQLPVNLLKVVIYAPHELSVSRADIIDLLPSQSWSPSSSAVNPVLDFAHSTAQGVLTLNPSISDVVVWLWAPLKPGDAPHIDTSRINQSRWMLGYLLHQNHAQEHPLRPIYTLQVKFDRFGAPLRTKEERNAESLSLSSFAIVITFEGHLKDDHSAKQPAMTRNTANSSSKQSSNIDSFVDGLKQRVVASLATSTTDSIPEAVSLVKTVVLQYLPNSPVSAMLDFISFIVWASDDSETEKLREATLLHPDGSERPSQGHGLTFKTPVADSQHVHTPSSNATPSENSAERRISMEYRLIDTNLPMYGASQC